MIFIAKSLYISNICSTFVADFEKSLTGVAGLTAKNEVNRALVAKKRSNSEAV